MSKKNELSTKQVQAINTHTAGVFNGLQQQAILKALQIALNPQEHLDPEQADPEDAAEQAKRLEKEQAERDAEAVKVAQEQARIINEAQVTPNVLNQGNYQDVVETTRDAVAARNPDVALEKAQRTDQGKAQADRAEAKPAKKVK